MEGDVTDATAVKYACRARPTTHLLSLGVELYEYQPTMMHTKAMVVDGVWSMFGSANFDNRSLELNDELNVAVAQPRARRTARVELRGGSPRRPPDRSQRLANAAAPRAARAKASGASSAKCSRRSAVTAHLCTPAAIDHDPPASSIAHRSAVAVRLK